MSARNILVVGGDTKGAWQMRGVQLGAAIGARVTAAPTASDWAWAEVVILVKRAAVMWADQAQRVRVPVIWDALDFWAQPGDNHRTRAELSEDVKRISRACNASHLIGATRQMAADIGGTYLSHHAHLGLAPDRIRPEAKIVAYQGTTKYLGKWFEALWSSCEKLGLSFVINPTHLREADILVAFRDGRWAGDVCRQWKSGVKCVNAVAAGTPILTQPSAAFSEICPTGLTCNQTSDLTDALREVSSRQIRELAYEDGRKRVLEFDVQTIAEQYLSQINRVRSVAA